MLLRLGTYVAYLPPILTIGLIFFELRGWRKKAISLGTIFPVTCLLTLVFGIHLGILYKMHTIPGYQLPFDTSEQTGTAIVTALMAVGLIVMTVFARSKTYKLFWGCLALVAVSISSQLAYYMFLDPTQLAVHVATMAAACVVCVIFWVRCGKKWISQAQ